MKGNQIIIAKSRLSLMQREVSNKNVLEITEFNVLKKKNLKKFFILLA